MIAIPLIILASCILLDLAWNQGDGLANIVQSFKNPRVSPEENRYAIIREMLEEIDKLRDDIEYEDEESKEIETIRQKISIRERILEKIL
jgi:hypothetical protein